MHIRILTNIFPNDISPAAPCHGCIGFGHSSPLRCLAFPPFLFTLPQNRPNPVA